MLVCLDAAALQFGDEGVDRRLVLVPCNYHAVYRKVPAAEHVYEAHDFQVVGYSEVLAGLVCEYVAGVDADDYLRLILHFGEQFYLCVFVETGQHALCVFVLHQLAAELQIEPVAALAVYALKDVTGLFFEILFRVKT